VDRAAVPHRLAPTRVPVELPAWPGAGEGLAFVFATDGVRSVAKDVDTGQDREFTLVPHGRGRFDAHGALRTTGGWFEVEDLPARFSAVFREAKAFTIELTVTPRHRLTEDRHILSFAVDEHSQNVSISQDGDHAELRIRTSDADGHSHTREAFGQFAAGEPTHLLVSYRPGRLAAYQDGRKVLDTDAVKADLSAWRDGARLAFAAPPLKRSGPLESELLARIVHALRLRADDVVDHQWVDNGPGWCAVRLQSAERVLQLQPDYAQLQGLSLGVVAAHPPGSEAQFEVRALIGHGPGYEDPVTGSLNASLAQWLIGAGVAPPRYVAAQGAALKRAGRVHVQRVGTDIWIGGDVCEVVAGTVVL
jgi:hypothetical protein